MSEFIEMPANKRSISKRKIIYGVGINDSTYMISQKINGKVVVCSYYRAWRHMLERCYCKHYLKRRPTYVGCSVCDEWLYFSNFRAWMKKQNWKGNALDKDLLVNGNKHYGAETCVFVSSLANSILSNSSAPKGKYLLGVSLDGCRLRVRCDIKGKNTTIGYFALDQEQIAENHYKKAKYKEVRRVADEQTDCRVKEALYARAEQLFNTGDNL